MVAARKPAARRTTPRKPKPKPLIALDIACGQNKGEGYVGIDLSGDADITHDLFEFPWPIATATVEKARCSHFVEHIPHSHPGWEKDGWWLFFEEVARVLVPGGGVEIWHPYSRSDRAFWDPTHQRFIHEQTWYYLDATWRASQGLDHYPTDVDFEVKLIQGLGVPNDVLTRSPEYQAQAIARQFNIYADLYVQLEKRG